MIRMVLLGLGFVAVTAALMLMQPGVLGWASDRASDGVPTEPVTRAEPAAVTTPLRTEAAADRVLGFPAGFTPATRTVTAAPVIRSAERQDDEQMRRMTWQALSSLNHVTGRDRAPGQPGSLLHTIVQRSLDGGAATPVTQTQPRLAAAPPVYIVQSGDSLVSIAEQVYGDVNMTGPLFAANQALLGRPDNLRVGQNLVLPKN